jgi:hypothetical protein
MSNAIQALRSVQQPEWSPENGLLAFGFIAKLLAHSSLAVAETDEPKLPAAVISGLTELFSRGLPPAVLNRGLESYPEKNPGGTSPKVSIGDWILSKIAETHLEWLIRIEQILGRTVSERAREAYSTKMDRAAYDLRQTLFHWVLGYHKYPDSDPEYLKAELVPVENPDVKTIDLPDTDKDWIGYLSRLPHIDHVKTRLGLEGLLRRVPLYYHGKCYFPNFVRCIEHPLGTCVKANCDHSESVGRVLQDCCSYEFRENRKSTMATLSADEFAPVLGGNIFLENRQYRASQRLTIVVDFAAARKTLRQSSSSSDLEMGCWRRYMQRIERWAELLIPANLVSNWLIASPFASGSILELSQLGKGLSLE